MKTFLSIGSGAGIGFATAERFAKEGFQVALGNRTLPKGRELADRLEAKGYRAEVLHNRPVLGGGNLRLLNKLPSGCRAGDNANAFLGGFRLWTDGSARSRVPPRVTRMRAPGDLRPR